MATFANEIKAFTQKAGVSFNTHYRKELIQLYINIVDGTPRDTGTLKNNWFFGKRHGPETNPKAKYPVGAESVQVFKAIANSSTITVKDEVFIYNNLPYARPIEEGLGKGERKAWRMVANAIALAKGKLSVKSVD